MRNRLTLIAAAILVATSAAAAERSGFYIGGDLGESSWGVFSKQDAKDIAYALEGIGGLYPGPNGNLLGVDATSTKASVDDTDFTYSLFVGYQFLPWLATEAGWMDLGKTTIKGAGTYTYLYNSIIGPKPGDPFGGSYSANAEVKTSGWALSVLPMLPIGDAWNLYGRLGYFWGDNKLDLKGSAEDVDAFGAPLYSYSDKLHGSDNNGAFLWGLGASWTWDRRVTLRFEYQQASDIIDLGGSKSSVDRYTLGMVYRFGHDEVAAPAPVVAPPVAAAPVVAAPKAPAKCADSDNDGVCDTADKCPNTLAGERVGPYGCPCDVTIQTHFGFDSAELTAEDKATLDKAAARMGDLQFVEGVASGYTDSTGKAAYNQKLSERRAQAVVDYLASKGVAAGRIKAVGYGAADPIADNATEEGRAQNRRVTIHRMDCDKTN